MRASNASIAVLLSLCLIGLAGCPPAHAPHNVFPPPPSEEVRRQLGKIGMEVKEETPSDQESLSLVRRVNWGDGGGSAAPFTACGPSLLCGGIILGQALAFGAHELGRENTADLESAIEIAFEQPFIQHTLRDDIVRTARDAAGQVIQVFDRPVQGDADTILEIESVARDLIRNSRFPERTGPTFYMSARVRLIQQATNKELYAGQIKHLGRTMSVAEWGANNAQRLHEEFDLASRALAGKIVDTLFLLYGFPEPDLR